MRSRNIAYLPEVDHLRAFAALLIVFYHGQHLFESRLANTWPFDAARWPQTDNPLMAVVLEGHTAVALFMVLSGFIFTYGAWGKRVRYGPFIANRLLRIYPLVLALAFVGAAASEHRFWLAGFLQTISPLSDFPGGLSLGPYSMLFWTVAVEFQFYLVFPFLIAIAQDRGPGTLVWLLAVAIALRFLALAMDIGASPRDMVYAHIAGRIDQFLLGMLAAILLRERAPSPRTCRTLLAAVAAAAIGLLFGYHRAGGWPNADAWKLLWPTVEGCVWAAFIAAYVGGRDFWPRSISRVLAACGTVSFSIYLLHFPIVYAMAQRRWLWVTGLPPALDPFFNTLLVALPVTLALSALTFAAVERPFLDMRRSYLAPRSGTD